MKLEHFGMPEPGDCRVVFSASAEELEAAVQAEQAAPDAPKEEEDLLTAAVNRAILEGFSPLFAQLMEEHRLVPVTNPDFELLAVNRAEGFRAGAEFFCLPPLELGRYTGFVQPIRPRPIRKLTLELEINRHHGDEDRAADEAGKKALLCRAAGDLQDPLRPGRDAGRAGAGLPTRRRGEGRAAEAIGGGQLLCRAAGVQPADAGEQHQL